VTPATFVPSNHEAAPWTLLVLLGVAFVGAGLVGLNVFVTAVGIGLEVLFVAFFTRHLAFAVAALRSGPVDVTAPAVETAYCPRVTAIVACKDEEAVVEDIVASLCALDYPSDLLQLVVVDDGSSDRTGEILGEIAARQRRLHCLHRPPGAGGGKSGALNCALAVADGDVVVVFDADHRPRPDVIRRLARHFEDPGVGAVQGRCQIRNADDSPLSRLIAIDYLAGYLVNEYGRQALYELPAYGGANCAVRTSSLMAIGGWNVRSVTEDTDLTLRLVLRGERVRYDVTAVDEEEAVATLRQFWRQRYRWARGHQQVWREYRRAVWASPFLTTAQKVETTMFLLVFHLPVLSGLGLLIVTAWLAGLVHPSDPTSTSILWTLLFLGPLAELGGGLLVLRSDRRLALRLPLFLPIFLVSIAVCSKAWVDGVLGRRYTWVKTRRFRDALPRPVRT
jgi:1,2-diacylglycerol 3-beta-glucosyltransferase